MKYKTRPRLIYWDLCVTLIKALSLMPVKRKSLRFLAVIGTRNEKSILKNAFIGIRMNSIVISWLAYVIAFLWNCMTVAIFW